MKFSDSDRKPVKVGSETKYYKNHIEINGIEYENVTPKFISSDNLIMSYFYYQKDKIDTTDIPKLVSYYSNLTNYEKFLLKRNTTKGVNAIDIDWNGAVINPDENPIYKTSDLLKVIKDIKDNVIYSAEDLWEDYVPTQNS